MINRRKFGLTVTFAALLALAPPCAANAQADSLSKIKERGTLKAGVKFDTPPFGFLDEKNEPTGFDLDIVRKIAEKPLRRCGVVVMAQHVLQLRQASNILPAFRILTMEWHPTRNRGLVPRTVPSAATFEV